MDTKSSQEICFFYAITCFEIVSYGNTCRPYYKRGLALVHERLTEAKQYRGLYIKIIDIIEAIIKTGVQFYQKKQLLFKLKHHT